jgi:hypothetical protein
MREDDFTTTEADAAYFAAIAGASEHIGSPVGDQEPNPLLDAPDARLRPDPWGLPNPKPTTPLDLPAEPPF